MIHDTSQTWNPDFLEQFPEFSSDLSRVTTFVLPSPGADCAHRETAGHSQRKNLPRAQRSRTQCQVFVSKFQVFVVLEDCAEPQKGWVGKDFYLFISHICPWQRLPGSPEQTFHGASRHRFPVSAFQ